MPSFRHSRSLELQGQLVDCAHTSLLVFRKRSTPQPTDFLFTARDRLVGVSTAWSTDGTACARFVWFGGIAAFLLAFGLGKARHLGSQQSAVCTASMV